MAKLIRDDIDRFFQHNIDLGTRTLYMGSLDTDGEGSESGVDYVMASYTIKGLHVLDNAGNRSEPKPINIIMNNPGGDDYHGLAIYDAIKSCQNEVIVKVYGHAMSMGSIILQAADERVLSPNSKVMLHYGSISFEGHSKNLERIAEENAKMNLWMEDLYLEMIKKKHPKFNRKRLRDLIKYDYFLSATEAVDLGLADRVE